MKKVILNLAVTLDGFIEGPNGEIDWCIMDDDMNFDAFIASIDTIFYGRVSYDARGIFSLMKIQILLKERCGRGYMLKISLFFQARTGRMRKLLLSHLI